MNLKCKLFSYLNHGVNAKNFRTLAIKLLFSYFFKKILFCNKNRRHHIKKERKSDSAGDFLS